jgi:predicted amidohydrolase YtcJ
MRFTASIVLSLALSLPCAAAADPDLIVHNGKVVTVDPQFSIRQAVAIKDGRIVAVGANDEVLAARTPRTAVIDLGGRTVLPGLIDSHVHPEAAMTEFDHPVPTMESMGDVLAYVKSRADALEDGQWVSVSQVFITRLREQRYPTRAELDEAAPKNPAVFSTGPDASLNSLALKLSGIDKDFKITDGGPGHVEKDPATGEPTGILRGCTRLVKSKSSGKSATEADRYRRTLELFRDYNANGLTTVADKSADPPDLERYRKMRDSGDLTVRMAASVYVGTEARTLDSIRKSIQQAAEHPLRKEDPSGMLRVIGVKTFLDGGMLTGSAYMREPWGVSKIYAITDPQYHGVWRTPPERLLPIVRATVEAGLQFTAHSVGDGAVHKLLDTYEQVGKELGDDAVRRTRPSITHCNFMSKESVEKLARLGAVADIQPVWLYMDARTLEAHFGYDRLRYFQPLKSLFEAGGIAGGGSDHMQKIGGLQSINPYNPFLGMATAVTRRARWYDRQLHPEEALTREQVIRFYTSNNAHLLFKEKDVGSLEPGKFADFIVIDTDLLTCPEENIRETKVLKTYLAGKQVYVARASSR